MLGVQSCLTLLCAMDCSPPGSSVHGILQARILEWLPFPSPIIDKGASQKKDGNSLKSLHVLMLRYEQLMWMQKIFLSFTWVNATTLEEHSLWMVMYWTSKNMAHCLPWLRRTGMSFPVLICSTDMHMCLCNEGCFIMMNEISFKIHWFKKYH